MAEDEKKREKSERPERKKPDYAAEFDMAWKLYPSRGNNPNPKKLAFKAWLARIKEGISPATLIECVKNYDQYVRRVGKFGTEATMHAATFFGPNERWADFEPRPDPMPTAKAAAKNGADEERPDPETGKAFIKAILESLKSKGISSR
jgi:hypothetical protein